MSRSMHLILVVAILIGAFLLAACSPGQITTSIKIAISAAEIAIPIVASQTNLDPAIMSAVVTYLHEANVALNAVTTILSEGGSASVQAAKITAALSNVASVNLPSGTPQAVASAVNKVAEAIAKVLANFATGGKPKLMKPGTTYKLNGRDKKNLVTAKARLAAMQLDIAKLKAAKK